MARRDRDAEATGELSGARPERRDPLDLPIGRSNAILEYLSAASPLTRSLVFVALVAIVAVVAMLLCFQPVRATDGVALAAASEAADELMGAVASSGQEARECLETGEWPVRGVVCIDAGHGATADLTLTPIGPGSEEMQYVEPGGTAGVVTGVPEYEVTLQVALLLEEKLEAYGVEVVQVRTTNDVIMSSEERAEIANEAGADIFLRLHCDGSEDPTVCGFSTLTPGCNEWTEPIYEASMEAAEIMQPIIVEKTGARDAGIVEREDLAGFNFCEVPSLLFEMGFMSNPDEDVLLCDPAYQDTLASAIADATVAYLRAIS